MKKKKVKILTSIAGLADPDKAKLDAKYERMRKTLNAQTTMSGRQRSRESVERIIDDEKVRDRYEAKPFGFKSDWVFKPGDEVFVDAEIAEIWAADGTATIIPDQEKKTAA